MLFQTINDGPCGCLCHNHAGTMHIMPCCAYSGVPRTEADARAHALRANYGADKTDKQPKYAEGERVRVNGWGGHDFGVVQNIKRTYHNRCNEWVWGYAVAYEGKGPGLSFEFVPEGYLQTP